MPVRTTAAWLGASLAAVCAVGILRAQSSAPAQEATAQFRSGVSLLRVDASVVDDTGRAVGDLKPEDFHVTIDGQPRKVVFARFTGADAGAPVAAAAGASVPSYVRNSYATGGRAIVLIVDLDSIRPGSERTILETAAQLVDKLRPIDAAALIPLPGTAIDLTRDHKRVSDALRSLRGTSPGFNYRYTFSLEEAAGYERRDKQVIDEVVERECSQNIEVARAQADVPSTCPPQIEREARDRLAQERLHIQKVLTQVAAVAAQLRSVRAPTSIVLLSAGLGFESGSVARFKQLQQELKDTGVAIATVQVEQPDVDASARASLQASFATHDRESGLANIATMSDGRFYAALGRAKGVFERLRTDVTEAYELGVEPENADLDGKPHEIKVTTARKAEVRARRYVLAAENRPADPAKYLATLIAQPVDVGDLPLAVAAHSVRGADPATLRVIIRADIGHGVTTTAPVRYQAVVIGANGNVGTNVTGIAASDGRVLISAQLAPGRYRVRLAAVEAGGRAGTLEVPIAAGLRAAGPFQLADLIVGTVADQSLTPSIYAAAGSPLIPTLEMTTADSARFAQASVDFEVRRSGSDEVVAATAGRLEQTQYERQQIARGSLPTSDLAAGEYTLSAIVKVDGQPQGRVSRSFVLEPAPARAAPAAAVPDAAAKPDASGTPTARITDPVVADAMQKAAAYVGSYGEKMSAVVGVEKYIQNVNPLNGVAPMRPRQIVAEFALVKSGGPIPWSGFRDVIEVNGDPVQDRRDRILKILTESDSPLEEAAKLMAESARFNVGPVSRNFNVPTSALFFFDRSNLSRFTFTRKGTSRIEGIETIEIAFKETARPTLIATRAGKDVPCEGTLWVSPSDGTIVRTRLQLRGFADALTMGDMRLPVTTRTSAPPPSVATAAPAPPPAPSGGGRSGGTAPAPAAGGRGGTGGETVPLSRPTSTPDFDPAMTQIESTAQIEVTYRRDEKIGMWLPAVMTEEYQGAIPRINLPPIVALARSKATYSDYKQFGTASTFGVKK